MLVSTRLLWERRFRGAYGLSTYCVSDDNSLLLLMPRPLEPRTYDLSFVMPDASIKSVSDFTVETLHKLSASVNSTICVGMTGDDFYIFQNGKKARLFQNKFLLTVDVEMDVSGSRAAGAYSDLAGENFTVFLVNLDGSVVWAQDVDFVPRVVATATGGRAVVAAGENGVITCQDVSARDVWRFRTEQPVTAVYCTADAELVVYGTAMGEVGAIDAFGTRRWQARLPGFVSFTRHSLLSGLTAAVVTGPENVTTLYLMDSQGLQCGTFPMLEAATGVAFSPNGTTLATSQKTGVVSFYALTVHSAADYAVLPQDVLGTAATLLQEEKWIEACRLLYDACTHNRQDVHLASHLAIARMKLVKGVIQCSDALALSGDAKAAIELVAQARLVHPLCVELLERERSYTLSASMELTSRAVGQLDSNVDAAERLLVQAIEMWDENVDAREHLATILQTRVSIADANANDKLAGDDLQGALADFMAAQQLMPTQDRSEKIHELTIQHEYNLGLEEYDAGNYDQAKFQFAKVLQLQPDNRQARRYMDFAEQFARVAELQNDPLNDRFRLLE